MNRVEALYAHAIAIEREAAERYGELAERMEDLGYEAVAEVFARLAQFEGEHLDRLLRRAAGAGELAPGQYRWSDADAPETLPRRLDPHALSSRGALRLALAAEYRAHAFFEGALLRADDPALRALAAEMARDEAEHIELLERLLEQADEALEDRV
jgi:rubrerythrin